MILNGLPEFMVVFWDFTISGIWTFLIAVCPSAELSANLLKLVCFFSITIFKSLKVSPTLQKKKADVDLLSKFRNQITMYAQIFVISHNSIASINSLDKELLV